MYDVHTNVMQYPKTMQPTHAKWFRFNDCEVEVNDQLGNSQNTDHGSKNPSIFTPVKSIYSRNYMIVDTAYETPTHSNLGIPGLDGDVYDIGFNGLSRVSEEIKAELPPKCSAAFEEALAKEMEWKNKWGTECSDSCRKDPIIDKGLIM
jgi:chromatin structure-remodeling complex protein RSC7